MEPAAESPVPLPVEDDVSSSYVGQAASLPAKPLRSQWISQEGLPEKELEIQPLARSLPGASRHKDSGQVRREPRGSTPATATS